MSSSPRKNLLITGATGKQGGAVVASILACEQASSFNIIGVTRDSTSNGAKKLASLPGVSVVEGSFSDIPAIFAKVGPVWGVFSVQVNSDDEERSGKAMVDAAVSHGVQHFVYSSGDRGGPEKSHFDPTTVKNFAAKYNIEKHLIAQATLSPQRMTYTILRPVTFFENLTPDIHGRGFTRMWEQLGPKKLQFVATADIGWFAASSFLDPTGHAGSAITIAGDELTQSEADATFKEVTGQPMPIGPCVIANAVKLVLRDTAGDMCTRLSRTFEPGSKKTKESGEL
ncbi:uncharacterized protein F5Z01DRAFT_723883 [Emericellopsis atlantica]|uniref:NmrA-like domain-containing protein n=1 Tax=Emericellopsis atlantica TaxID=2614577 RepID=A0A9P7ZKU2_9HYPO|nr:uncharacterized protein F5Z01DRAFT_723883 [Emericellopsis atlantica]KAG9253973.1 hypothetical protein F5Z01DRAFT_723883 [Emericellopsis atlantica]